MKFDFVIGNPPYQESKEYTKDLPLYHYFMDASYSIARNVLLITPARFLFNAGQTPKEWNKKMLSDPHLKVLMYEQDSSKVFPNTDIKGGVVITYRNYKDNFGAIDVFTHTPELNTILHKVNSIPNEEIAKIIYMSSCYRIKDTLFEDFPIYKDYFSSGKFLHSNIFDKLPELFTDDIPSSVDEYFQVYGLQKGIGRTIHFMKRKYVDYPNNLSKWKVFVPKSNGSGALGEVLSTPLIGKPLIGHTQTFMSIGCFDTEQEAQNLLKYIKSKFARTMLGVLKVTQDNPPKTWKYVPLQDFTSSSDIDWTRSVHEIDLQLYDKYGLTAEERNFIETNVKEMD